MSGECQKIRQFWGGKYDLVFFYWGIVGGEDNFGAK